MSKLGLIYGSITLFASCIGIKMQQLAKINDKNYRYNYYDRVRNIHDCEKQIQRRECLYNCTPSINKKEPEITFFNQSGCDMDRDTIQMMNCKANCFGETFTEKDFKAFFERFPRI